ncbi:pyridoxamine 5'-phosphate oxidase family protein [Flavobacterium algicola]|uniref:pyridoxamine 5'-phosphate oxidase family protein n=1 Tax=Flavobacterium algicola TaxID=556529 RepID=UPI001EFC61AC|nr:pyridoxamine 5'-phosphate oxidase family protein [Flavobacterium algicola]MCG9792189.1 pyridoxamine 5'-phosphate oxidase family protein [Flavobacterium algicola]
MGDHKDLTNASAAEKIKDLAEDIKTCMFCTYNGDKLNSRPMSAQKIDDEGNLWFLSDKTSEKNEEILQNPKVELFFSEPQNQFLTIHGHATISYDRDLIKELFTPIVKVWMPEGSDDPNLSVIKVVPKEGYYWNNKHNRIVAMAKMTTAFVTGQTMDDGIEGNLKL